MTALVQRMPLLPGRPGVSRACGIATGSGAAAARQPAPGADPPVLTGYLKNGPPATVARFDGGVCLSRIRKLEYPADLRRDCP